MRASNSILAILVLLCGTVPALAIFPGWQKSSGKQTSQPPPKSSGFVANPQSSSNASQFTPRGPGPHRGDWLRKYGNLPPSQQEQQLKQDPGFRNLSPEKQNQLLDRLHYFNSQPPRRRRRFSTEWRLSST